jgi:8-oxo-dGTP pyrophosphatase MutT (NUDIX family)
VNSPNEPIEQLRRATVFENQFVTVFNDSVRFNDGSLGQYVRIRPGNGLPGVVIVPHSSGKLGLVKVFRYPIGAWQWGFPRGFAHDADPLTTAKAELAEELGLEGPLSLIGWFTPDSGLLDSRVAVVLADVDQTAANPVDVREVADVAWLTIPELQANLGEPEYDDGMTMAALALVAAKGVELGPSPTSD